MAYQIIELENGVYVEVEIPEEQAQQISGGVIKKIPESIEQIKPVLLAACKPLSEVWNELNQDLSITEANVEFQFGFNMKGHIFIAAGEAKTNIKVSLKMIPKP